MLFVRATVELAPPLVVLSGLGFNNIWHAKVTPGIKSITKRKKLESNMLEAIFLINFILLSLYLKLYNFLD